MADRVNDLVFETENYRLRPLTIEDASERYIGWLNDEEVTRFLEVRHHNSTLEDVRSYIASHNNKTSFLFGIFTRDGLHIGNFSLRIDPHNRIGFLGVMVGDRDYWGQNVVLANRAVLLDYVFDKLGLHKVEGGCLITNLPALYNYRRQGWHHEATYRERALALDGSRVDIVMFGMLASEWKEARAKEKKQ